MIVSGQGKSGTRPCRAGTTRRTGCDQRSRRLTLTRFSCAVRNRRNRRHIRGSHRWHGVRATFRAMQRSKRGKNASAFSATQSTCVRSNRVARGSASAYTSPPPITINSASPAAAMTASSEATASCSANGAMPLRVSTRLRRPGNARPIACAVLRPISTGLPSVSALKRLRSSGKCHGIAPSRPMAQLRSSAAMSEIIVPDGGYSCCPIDPEISRNGTRHANACPRFRPPPSRIADRCRDPRRPRPKRGLRIIRKFVAVGFSSSLQTESGDHLEFYTDSGGGINIFSGAAEG